MREVAYVNGVLSSVEEAHVSIDDRGLQFGDGVYEVVRSYDGRLWALERHLTRLEQSLKAIWIENIAIEDIRTAVLKAYDASEIPNALVYFQVTRGISARDYLWHDGIQPTLIVTVRTLVEKSPINHERGVSVATHPEIRWGRVDIKSLNLLGNMIAKKSARERGAYEAVFVTNDSTMTEGASTSLFIVKDGRIITREKGNHILPGVTRDIVLECIVEANLSLDERPFSYDEMLSADEVLLTGTTFGVYSVVRVDETTIGGGTPGGVGRELARRYRQRVAEGRDAPNIFTSTGE